MVTGVDVLMYEEIRIEVGEKIGWRIGLMGREKDILVGCTVQQ